LTSRQGSATFKKERGVLMRDLIGLLRIAQEVVSEGEVIGRGGAAVGLGSVAVPKDVFDDLRREVEAIDREAREAIKADVERAKVIGGCF
jgi:hypothetical protein